MIDIPEMVMIGGNSRNSGKTTIACRCISKLSANHEVIGLKVTSVRPGEDDLHGNHTDDFMGNFTIFEELNPESNKDTSKMLKAGATHVYYIRVEEKFTKQAIVHFVSRYVDKQLIVCESRSLREIVKPGLFLIMMRLQVEDQGKDMSKYLNKADKVFYFGDDLAETEQFAANLDFINCKFVRSS
jgi:hypothetical protein